MLGGLYGSRLSTCSSREGETTPSALTSFPSSQVFFAYFCMTLALSRTQLLEWTHDDDSRIAKAKAVAFYSLVVLIHDTKQLVAKHVRHSITTALKNGSTAIRAHALRRSNALKAWQSNPYALAWDNKNGPHGNYTDLTLILSDDHNTPLTQLHHASTSYSYHELAQHLLKMKAKSYSAPISGSGIFLTSLSMASNFLIKYGAGFPDPHLFASNIFTHMLTLLRIHLVPWHKEYPDRTSRYRAPLPDWWMIIKRSSSSPNIPLSISQDITHTLTQQLVFDKNAPWSIPSTLSEMKDLWQKNILPQDWDLKHASLDRLRLNPDSEYVAHAYDYVAKNFTSSNWVHHLALIIGILFSRVAPTIFWSKDLGYTNHTDSASITAHIRSFPWIKSQSKYHKGVTSPMPFITMVTTTLISFLDPLSPFYSYLDRQNNQQGKPWTSKHGIFLLF
ncbi:hypothetical protein BD779DRAFT_1679983 [Infundibulicybe gibba]|nr:hypothetical protein BD779DRAFT_1679983 [Infundibulicybe gibba]